MSDFQEEFEIDDIIIEFVRDRPPLHHANVYTESDERYWDKLQKNTGIQKSWLKKRWKKIRNDHKRITIYNHIHGKKVPLHRMANHLSFLVVDLNGTNKMDFEDFEQRKSESFCITQEMIDGCDINESVTNESISIPKLSKVGEVVEATVASYEPVTEAHSKQTKMIEEDFLNEICVKSTNQPNSEINRITPGPSERSEDTIFGELVVAMLKKLDPDEKKRAKKEIMNILL